jgi:ABC-type nitrate/sulfonate/bicarbonate transport system permease component
MAATFFKAPELLTALFAMLLLGVALDRLLRLIRARVLVWLHELATAVVPLDGMAGPCA